MATDYLIDKTPLIGIQYGLQKQAMYGASARLGFLRIGTSNSFENMIINGALDNWRGRKPTNPHAGQNTRFFDVLLVAPVTTLICNAVAALQVNNVIFKKIAQTPWDGSTPAQWIFECEIQFGVSPVDLSGVPVLPAHLLPPV